MSPKKREKSRPVNVLDTLRSYTNASAAANGGDEETPRPVMRPPANRVIGRNSPTHQERRAAQAAQRARSEAVRNNRFRKGYTV